jgi:OmcA/MtrC family decaheme c-type cytochrome
VNDVTLSMKNRRTPLWTKLAAASLLSIAIAGCGGGSDGATGAAGAAGATGATGATGAAGKDLVNVTSVSTNATPATPTAAATWAALAPQVTVQGVTIASPPVVRFTVKDAAGNPIVGLGNKSQSATATVAGLTNIAFTLAKLVPGTNNEPSKWVSYLVTKPVTVAQAAGTIGAADSCNKTATAAATWCGTFPTTDAQGTLVDNGDGSYVYTFYRDVKAVKDVVASLTDSTDGLAKKADLGDLTFDATLTHRLGIQIGGAAPGTGSNTPNAVTNASYPGVNMVNTANAVYDFRPDGAAVTNTRDIVKIESCASCHDGKVLAHGSRKDPKYCMTCHTDQIKYTFSQEATSSNGGLTLTGTTRPTTAIVNGRALGNYPNMIHKIHMGEELVKQGYYFNAATEGQFNEVRYPQDRANCTKCHTGTASTSGGNTNVTANGDNWKNVPSLLACGACHDGINFAAGTGVTLADRDKDVLAKVAVGTTQTGHIGGAKADNATCILCHDATTIPVYHQTTFATPNNPVTATGLANFAYDVKSVTVNASKQPVITFQIKKDGAVVTSLAVPTLVTHATSGQQVVSPTYEPIAGFTGGPSLYVAYAVPEDGITAPADFNVNKNVSLTNLLIASGSPKAGSLSNTVTSGSYVADANGYFTATLTGDTVGQAKGVCAAPVAPATAACVITAVVPAPVVIPAAAKMVTGAIIGSFTQKAGPGITAYVAANVSTNPTTSASGGQARVAVLKKLVATGYTARRVIVDSAKCNSCHDQLGTAPNFHSGARNDATACNFCHNNTQTSGGWSSNSNTFIHGIHGSSKRTQAYTWQSALSYGTLGYPGVLKDCGQCHVANAVNYGTAGTTLQPNLLWPTVATGTTAAAGASTSPYIAQAAGTKYGVGFSYTTPGQAYSTYTLVDGTVVPAGTADATLGFYRAAEATTLVSSPIASACFSCHDTAAARGHMTTNGGAIYEARSSALLKTESCLVCHGAGTQFDAAVVHQ